jgi:hypothetical protein
LEQNPNKQDSLVKGKKNPPLPRKQQQPFRSKLQVPINKIMLSKLELLSKLPLLRNKLLSKLALSIKLQFMSHYLGWHMVHHPLTDTPNLMIQ